VSRRAGAHLEVDTAVGTLRAVSDGPVGERCVLAIRPENVAVDAKAADGAGNVVRGRVSFVSYLGSALRYERGGGPRAVLKADIPRSLAPRAAVHRPGSRGELSRVRHPRRSRG